MRKASIARLSLLLVILAFSLMPAPSHAFPLCPYDPCSYVMPLCEDTYGGTIKYVYSGWCQDENFYLRGYYQFYCSTYGYMECADW